MTTIPCETKISPAKKARLDMEERAEKDKAAAAVLVKCETIASIRELVNFQGPGGFIQDLFFTGRVLHSTKVKRNNVKLPGQKMEIFVRALKNYFIFLL